MDTLTELNISEMASQCIAQAKRVLIGHAEQEQQLWCERRLFRQLEAQQVNYLPLIYNVIGHPGTRLQGQENVLAVHTLVLSEWQKYVEPVTNMPSMNKNPLPLPPERPMSPLPIPPYDPTKAPAPTPPTPVFPPTRPNP